MPYTHRTTPRLAPAPIFAPGPLMRAIAPASTDSSPAQAYPYQPSPYPDYRHRRESLPSTPPETPLDGQFLSRSGGSQASDDAVEDADESVPYVTRSVARSNRNLPSPPVTPERATPHKASKASRHQSNSMIYGLPSPPITPEKDSIVAQQEASATWSTQQRLQRRRSTLEQLINEHQPRGIVEIVHGTSGSSDGQRRLASDENDPNDPYSLAASTMTRRPSEAYEHHHMYAPSPRIAQYVPGGRSIARILHASPPATRRAGGSVSIQPRQVLTIAAVTLSALYFVSLCYGAIIGSVESTVLRHTPPTTARAPADWTNRVPRPPPSAQKAVKPAGIVPVAAADTDAGSAARRGGPRRLAKEADLRIAERSSSSQEVDEAAESEVSVEGHEEEDLEEEGEEEEASLVGDAVQRRAWSGKMTSGNAHPDGEGERDQIGADDEETEGSANVETTVELETRSLADQDSESATGEHKDVERGPEQLEDAVSPTEQASEKKVYSLHGELLREHPEFAYSNHMQPQRRRVPPPPPTDKSAQSDPQAATDVTRAEPARADSHQRRAPPSRFADAEAPVAGPKRRVKAKSHAQGQLPVNEQAQLDAVTRLAAAQVSADKQHSEKKVTTSSEGPDVRGRSAGAVHAVEAQAQADDVPVQRQQPIGNQKMQQAKNAPAAAGRGGARVAQQMNRMKKMAAAQRAPARVLDSSVAAEAARAAVNAEAAAADEVIIVKNAQGGNGRRKVLNGGRRRPVERRV